MIRFEKVSFNEYLNSRIGNFDMDKEIYDNYVKEYKKEWEDIKLPIRSTSLSAGYDFFAPYDIILSEPRIYDSIFGESVTQQQWATFPTGIRFVTDRDDIFLMCVPRSGLGFKNITRLANTCGIIDADYQFSDNEGHIKVKMTADKTVAVQAGKAIMQAMIVPFVKTDDDCQTETRNGGFGSTDITTETRA